LLYGLLGNNEGLQAINLKIDRMDKPCQVLLNFLWEFVPGVLCLEKKNNLTIEQSNA